MSRDDDEGVIGILDFELLAARFDDVDTTAVSDGDKSIRVVSSAITLRSARGRICAPAYTIRTRRDFFAVAVAVERAPQASVVVVDAGGDEVAVAGELFARAAMIRGLAGIIVDGGYRDIGFVRSCPLPVYSRHITPMAGTARDLGVAGQPVTCGGVVVNPGDVVLADDEGILVLAPDRAMELVVAARDVKDAEARAIRRMTSGASLSDCLNIDEHATLLENGQPTSLRFLV